MFTGIIESLGSVKTILDLQPPLRRITLEGLQCHWASDSVHVGDSIAVNGVCLTVETIDFSSGAPRMTFALSSETLEKTNLKFLSLHDRVNLERALKLGDRLSGHMVQGHVDGLGELLSIEGCYELKIRLTPFCSRYVVEKGSICIDGISLTVNRIEGTDISLTIIPHTWANTHLSHLKVGALVNIEVDVLSKYVEKLCIPYLKS